MGITLTDVLLFGKAQSDDVDNATLVIYRRNILRWSALGGYLDIIVKGVSPLSLPDAIANSLSYVKAFGGTEQRNLPDNYIERQFIYMMDGSYLLTDIVPTYDGKIEMDFQTTTIPSGSVYFIGGRTATYGGLFFARTVNAGFIVDAFGARHNSGISVSDNTRYKFTYDNQVAKVESAGTTLFTNTFTGTDATGAALVINGLNSSGTVTGAQSGIYLYSFKVWNAQGELVADYVPAIQKGTVPVVGFYDTVSGTFKTATAGTFAAGGEAVPTPDTPIDIVSNNGVLKYGVLGKNLFDKSDVITGKILNDTGAEVSQSAGYYSGHISVDASTEYTISQTGGEEIYLRILEYDSTDTMVKLNKGTQTGTQTKTFTTGATTTYVIVSGSTKSDALDTLQLELGSTATTYEPYREGIYTDGTVETIRVSGNLVEFNETRIDNTTWATADKTKGFEVYADVYGKSVGGNLFDNANCFGIFVPCKKGQSVSIDFFDYDPYYSRCYYCEVTADGKVNTAPATYASSTSLTQKTFTLTQDDSVGFVIEWYITAAQTRNYTKENYTVVAGTTPPTQYIPFNICTAVAEMLLKIDSTYTDQQEIIDGTVTRKVGIKVLDGTEAWAPTLYPQTNAYRISWTGATATLGTIRYSGLFCTHFEDGGSASTQAPNKMFFANDLNINFPMTSDFDTIGKCLQYLADQYAAGTPVIVIYPLATPTTESVTGQTLQVTDGDNVLEITQASLNGVELEAEYQAAVSLTIQEVQDANLDPNVEVTIN